MAIVMMATTTLTAVTMAVTAVDLTLIPLTAQPANVLNQLAFKIRILFSKFNQNQSIIRHKTYAILGVQIVHTLKYLIGVQYLIAVQSGTFRNSGNRTEAKKM